MGLIENIRDLKESREERKYIRDALSQDNPNFW